MYLAVFHLLAHGHKNIIFVGLNPDLYTMMERYKSCASAMRLRASLKMLILMHPAETPSNVILSVLMRTRQLHFLPATTWF
jgi:DNA-binding LacI/PurR family transcriptional regulator